MCRSSHGFMHMRIQVTTSGQYILGQFRQHIHVTTELNTLCLKFLGVFITYFSVPIQFALESCRHSILKLTFFQFYKGSQGDVVYIGWPIAPSYMSPMAGGGGVGLRGLSQWVQLCTWSPNILLRSYFIFNLCSCLAKQAKQWQLN